MVHDPELVIAIYENEVAEVEALQAKGLLTKEEADTNLRFLKNWMQDALKNGLTETADGRELD
jgi:hypothetical protein